MILGRFKLFLSYLWMRLIISNLPGSSWTIHHAVYCKYRPQTLPEVSRRTSNGYVMDFVVSYKTIQCCSNTNWIHLHESNGLCGFPEQIYTLSVTFFFIKFDSGRIAQYQNTSSSITKPICHQRLISICAE
jgi:hypothetical protein